MSDLIQCSFLETKTLQVYSALKRTCGHVLPCLREKLSQAHRRSQSTCPASPQIPKMVRIQ